MITSADYKDKWNKQRLSGNDKKSENYSLGMWGKAQNLKT